MFIRAFNFNGLMSQYEQTRTIKEMFAVDGVKHEQIPGLETELAEWQERAGKELVRLNHARDIKDEAGIKIHEANMNRAIQTYVDIGRAACDTTEFEPVE